MLILVPTYHQSYKQILVCASYLNTPKHARSTRLTVDWWQTCGDLSTWGSV